MNPKLSIIIVNWNTQALLGQCLESIVQSSKCKVQSCGIEVIVVDNGSTDDSVEWLRQFKVQSAKSKVVVIENKENFGFGKANNQGIKVAEGDYIMLLNSDTIVKPNAIEQLVEYLDNHPDTAVVGPKLLNTDGTPQANCGRFPNLLVSFVMLFIEKFTLKNLVRYSPDNTAKVDWLMGAAFVARREVFDQVGGFDEGIFMYMEEVEWFYRVNQHGYRVDCYPKAEITHLGRGSSKSGKKDPILNIYRGLIHFHYKHYGKTAQILLLIMLKSKALLTYIVGLLLNNRYLKETYAEALKIR